MMQCIVIVSAASVKYNKVVDAKVLVLGSYAAGFFEESNAPIASRIYPSQTACGVCGAVEVLHRLERHDPSHRAVVVRRPRSLVDGYFNQRRRICRRLYISLGSTPD